MYDFSITNNIITFLSNDLNKYNLSLNYNHVDIKKNLKLNLKINDISLFVCILDRFSLFNYYLKPNLYRKSINNLLYNYSQNSQNIKENLSYIIKNIIKRDELELYNYFSYLCVYFKLDWVIQDTNNPFNINNIMTCCLEYSLEIFYKIYEKHKFKIDINYIVREHLTNNYTFYNSNNIKINNIYGTNHNKLFTIIKQNMEIFPKLLITNNNINFIEALVFFINKQDLYNNYLKNLCGSGYYHKIKNLIKYKHLNFKQIEWVTLCRTLIESKDYNSQITHNSNQWLKIALLLVPYITTFINEEELKTILLNVNLNSFFTIKNNIEIVKLLDPYINYSYTDIGSYTLLHDCARYGGFNTLKFLLTKQPILDLLFDTTYDNNNIISCSLYNIDDRILKYTMDFLSKYYPDNLNILLNNNLTRYSIYIDAMNNSIKTTKNFKTIKKKIKLFVKYCIHNIDSKQKFLESILSHNYYNIKLGNLIFSLLPSININNLYTINTDYYYFNITHINYNYVKTFIDHILIKTPKDIKSVLIFISNLVCLHNTQIYDYLVEKFNKTPLLLKTFLETMDQDFLIIINIINKVRFCDQCKSSEISNTNKHINYYRTYFLKNNKVTICFPDNDTYIFKNKTMVDCLITNGIHPNNPNYINYTQYLLSLINTKKKHHKNSIKYYIYKWRIVLLVLKHYIRKKYKKNLSRFKSNFIPIHFQLSFNPNQFNLDKKNPIHIKPLDILLNPLNKTHTFITQKADGVKEIGLYNIYPPINNGKILYIEYSKIEYEFIEKHNLCMIYGINDSYISNYELIRYLRSLHPYITHPIFDDFTDTSDIVTIMEQYKLHEGMALNKYIKENRHSHKKLWWPKFIWRIDIPEYKNYIKTLGGITHIYNSIVSDVLDTDGWVLSSDNNETIYKIKPYSHLTIDLLFNDNKMYFNNKIECQYKFDTNFNNLNLINNKIYRCYFDALHKKWQAKEIRYDKFKPNSIEICRYINQFHLNQWFISDLKLITPYYQTINYNPYKIKKSSNSLILNTLKKYGCSEILDLGCGFNYKNYIPKQSNYIGFDCDYKILQLQNNNRNRNNNQWYIVDIKEKWDFDTQLQIFGSYYKHIQNIGDFKKKYNTFDTILCINTIHYCINTDTQWHTFLSNIDNITKTNSKFIIRYLDSDKLNELFIKYRTNTISHNSSFIRKMNTNINTNSNYKIKIYYEWCHRNPIEETVINKPFIVSELKKYNWVLNSYIETPNSSETTPWDEYFNCFSILVFTKL